MLAGREDTAFHVQKKGSWMLELSSCPQEFSGLVGGKCEGQQKKGKLRLSQAFLLAAGTRHSQGDYFLFFSS